MLQCAGSQVRFGILKMAVAVHSGTYLYLRIDVELYLLRFLIHVYLPDRRQAKRYTTNYNCVIVKGDCLVVVLVFGHHGVS